MRKTPSSLVAFLAILAFGETTDSKAADGGGREGIASLAQPIEAARSLIEPWWRWRVDLPELAVPAADPVGRYCGVAQAGDAWFLAGFLSTGAQSQVTRRHCGVPRGKSLFFPVLTTVKFAHGEPEAMTCEQAKAAAAAKIDNASEAFATLDGEKIDIVHLRAASDACFQLSPNGKAKTYPAAADGIWLLLAPLSPGQHILVYGSRYKSGSWEEGQYQLTSYDLSVQ